MRLNQLGLSSTRLILIAAGFITVYFGFTIVGNGLHQYQLDRENEQIERRIVAGQNEYARLRALRDWMQSDAFVEAAARQQGLVKPGDHPITVTAPMATPAPGDAREWWKHYLEP